MEGSRTASGTSDVYGNVNQHREVEFPEFLDFVSAYYIFKTIFRFGWKKLMKLKKLHSPSEAVGSTI